MVRFQLQTHNKIILFNFNLSSFLYQFSANSYNVLNNTKFKGTAVMRIGNFFMVNHFLFECSKVSFYYKIMTLDANQFI